LHQGVDGQHAITCNDPLNCIKDQTLGLFAWAYQLSGVWKFGYLPRCRNARLGTQPSDTTPL
jgi:hypothetical protein